MTAWFTPCSIVYKRFPLTALVDFASTLFIRSPIDVFFSFFSSVHFVYVYNAVPSYDVSMTHFDKSVPAHISLVL